MRTKAIGDRTLFEPPRDRADPPMRCGPDFRAMHFDSQNGHVYKAFERCALALIGSGVRHYGAKAIFEYLRYATNVRGLGDQFKLNNNYTAYYARKFEKLHPEHEGFFSIRNKND